MMEYPLVKTKGYFFAPINLHHKVENLNFIDISDFLPAYEAPIHIQFTINQHL